LERSPTNEGQTSTRLQRSADISKRCHWVAKEHHAKARESRIEDPTSEITGLSVHFSEGHPKVWSWARATVGHVKHGLGNINAHNRTGWPNSGSKGKGRLPAPAADVDDMLAFSWF
jgi:hypothetical protein